MVDDVVVRCKDTVGEPVVAHELPDIFNRVKLGAFGWQRDNADVAGYLEFSSHMPTRLIHEYHGMGARRYCKRDFGEMERHGLGITKRQNQTCTLAKLGTNCPEDIGRLRPLILGCRGPRPALGPAPRNLVLLADPRFVLEPYLYRGALREARFDLCQLGCKAPLLKASRANSF